MYPVHAPACLSGKPAVCEFRYQQPELITAGQKRCWEQYRPHHVPFVLHNPEAPSEVFATQHFVQFCSSVKFAKRIYIHGLRQKYPLPHKVSPLINTRHVRL